MKRPGSATLLAGALAITGTLHFLLPRPFDSIVPRRLPGSPRTWTYASGMAELGCAAAVATPRTRRAGATATTALFAAVFPANVKMALDYRHRSRALRFVAYARLPLQIPLIRWSLGVRRNTAR
ncbi:Uncharacterized membrane protein [Actinopolyspora xinjiangensis]|uniref:Uncharacterized membrane protein n=1 Tax=Actinopolyspora xinjiangensis TaxID=405564 RepID=A0A1H0VYV7_9ACTN|nr:hypothetical protein [Actinopolyspora xinjiangensis]SDP83729.1 Uncharacterized membrane protein [Actinopolyspora xinjiangensis]